MHQFELDQKKGGSHSVCRNLSGGNEMSEFNVGDIITAEFVVEEERIRPGSSIKVLKERRCGEWELVRRALDLTKPLGFVDDSVEDIIYCAMRSTTAGFLVVEYGLPGGPKRLKLVRQEEVQNVRFKSQPKVK